MCNDDAILRNFYDAFGDFKKFRCRLEHRIIDAGQLDDKRLYRYFGIDQADELVNDLLAVVFVDGDFGDAFFIVLPSGSFYVEYCVQNLVFSVQ